MCRLCRYFDGTPVRRYDKDEAATHHEEGRITVADGTCKRFPKWEEVNSEHTCGEFKPRKEG